MLCCRCRPFCSAPEEEPVLYRRPLFDDEPKAKATPANEQKNGSTANGFHGSPEIIEQGESSGVGGFLAGAAIASLSTPGPTSGQNGSPPSTGGRSWFGGLFGSGFSGSGAGFDAETGGLTLQAPAATALTFDADFDNDAVDGPGYATGDDLDSDELEDWDD